MNPSYSNGGTNAGGQQTPGVKPGVIASGPDPADVPVNKPVAMPSKPMSLGDSSGRSRVSSILGKIKDSKSASQPALPPVQLSNAGGAKRSKKGLVIGGLAAIVILIVVLVVVMLMGGGKKATNGTTGDGSHDSFLKYANYLLTGKENTNELGSFDDSKDYTVMQKFAEKDTAFFDKAQELWKAFYEKITTSENYSETSDIAGDVVYQNQLMDFVTRYVTISEWQEDDLLKLFLEKGVDSGSAEIDNHYTNLTGTIFEEGKEYVDKMVAHSKKALQLLALYNSNGCIVNGEVDNACVGKNNAAIASLQSEYNAEGSLIDYAILDKTISRLEEFCFKINKDFRSENGS